MFFFNSLGIHSTKHREGFAFFDRIRIQKIFDRSLLSRRTLGWQHDCELLTKNNHFYQQKSHIIIISLNKITIPINEIIISKIFNEKIQFPIILM